MFKKEFYTAIKSNRVKIVFALFLVIVLYDLFLNWKADYWYYFYEIRIPSTDPRVLHTHTMHPAFASFLSSSSIGHLPQIILKWILPIYALYMYADTYISEKKLGYCQLLRSRASSKKVLGAKFATAFSVAFIVTIVVLLINYGLANILFFDCTSFRGMEKSASTFTGIMGWSMSNPYLAYFVYIVVFSLMMGILSMFCLGVCLMFPNYIVVYPVCFFVWFILINLPKSLLSITQSFAAYSNSEMLCSSTVFLLVALIGILAGYFYRVRKDEL